MSRIGRMPIAITAGVTVEVAENNKVTVKGPKGTLERVLPSEMDIKMEGSEIYEDINTNGAYDELSHNDKLEEALVHEFSDYFTRVLKDYRDRDISLEEVDWESILSDALQIDVSEFYDENIYSVMQLTLSEFHNNYSTQKTIYNKQNALKSIRLSNIKSELLKNASTDSGYRLIEICE